MRSLKLITNIFNPSNYYDKTATDALLNDKIDFIPDANDSI